MASKTIRVPSGPEPFGKILLISVASYELALPIKRMLVVAASDRLVKAPDLPSVFCGFLRHEEKLFPIVKLDTLFRIATPRGYPDVKAIVVETPMPGGASKTFGLLVDEVLGQYEIDHDRLFKIYGHYLLRCIDYNVEIFEQFYPMISPISLLEEIENFCIEQFAETPFRREGAKKSSLK